MSLKYESGGTAGEGGTAECSAGVAGDSDFADSDLAEGVTGGFSSGINGARWLASSSLVRVLGSGVRVRG